MDTAAFGSDADVLAGLRLHPASVSTLTITLCDLGPPGTGHRISRSETWRYERRWQGRLHDTVGELAGSRAMLTSVAVVVPMNFVCT